MLLKTVVLENTLESSLDCKEIQLVHPKGNQSWIFTGRTDAEAEAAILWPPDGKNWLTGKKPWCWERLKAGGEGDDRGWDGWMTSPTRWTRVWTSSGSWSWTGKPGVLQPMESQRVGHDWETEPNWMRPLTRQSQVFPYFRIREQSHRLLRQMFRGPVPAPVFLSAE